MSSSSSSTSSPGRTRKASSVSHVYYANAVYFPNQKIYSGETPGALNFSCINTVYYCFASVALDGGVFLSDEYADARAPCDGVSGGLGSLMHLKQKHPHLRVVLSIGGAQASQVFPTVAASAVLRDNFARSARGLVEASGLDGIDSMDSNPTPTSSERLRISTNKMLPRNRAVAWQYPTDSLQGANLLALLAAVRLYLPEEQYLLAAALPAARSVLGTIDLQRAAVYLDVLNLMAYDLSGSRSGHHAQLYPSSSKEDESSSASGAVSYLLNRGFPGRKILLGIPVFGRRGTSSGGGSDGRVDYRHLPRKGTKEQVDKRACAAYCVGGGSGFVSYDNPETVKTKAAFVKQKGLGGLFYFNGPADAKDSKRSLIATGFKALHSSG